MHAKTGLYGRFALPFSAVTAAVLAAPPEIGNFGSSVRAGQTNTSSRRITSTQVNESLGLRKSKVAPINLPAAQNDGLSVAVPIADESALLILEEHSARSADYKVQIDMGGGELIDVPAGPVRTYRGHVAGKPGSTVAAFRDQDGLHARVLLPDSGEHWIEPLRSRMSGAAANEHAVYANEDVIPSMSACDANDGMRLERGMRNSPLTLTDACGTGLCIAEIACDADVEFFQHYGSVSAVENRINAVINMVNIAYERDVAIRHVISAIVIRTAEPDPYSATSANTLLTQFRTHWLNNHGSVQRDMAELFTGKNLDGSTIGIAWIGAVCGSYAYSVVQSDCCNSLGCAADLTAHELGHNWNAGHCSCSGSPSYTMNSYITCANQFHPTLTVPVMNNFRDSRSCLSAGNGCSSNAACSDGLFCNGAEVCSAGSCLPGTPPCTSGQVCNESTDTCTVIVCNNDGFCGGQEDCSNCASDCWASSGGVCGNSICEAGAAEDCVNCPQDCAGVQSGALSGQYCCGDGSGTNPVACADSRCASNGRSCNNTPGTPSCCGDNTCNGLETRCNCMLDCGAPWITETTCANNADDDCDGMMDCDDADCAANANCVEADDCGNDVCDEGEDCLSCPDDCRSRMSGRESRRFCCGDGITQQPEALYPSLCGGNN